jgi:hypothetical protein
MTVDETFMKGDNYDPVTVMPNRAARQGVTYGVPRASMPGSLIMLDERVAL